MQEVISFFKYLASSNTINFILMVVILAWICKKFNIVSTLENAISAVRGSISKSEDEKHNSESVYAQSKKMVEELPKELEKLRTDANSKAEVLKDKINSSTENTISSIKDNAEKAISIEEKKISDSLTRDAVNSSVTKAKERIQKLLKENPELHKKFIYESLEELDKVQL